jgi:hypothetical protein
MGLRELSVFVDESGGLGPFVKHLPFYILSLVFHYQSDKITGHLDRIHAGLRTRGMSAEHAVHAGPLSGLDLIPPLASRVSACILGVPD